MKSYIKTGIVCVSLMAISACSTGCASYMVYNKSHEKVAMRKAMAKGDEKAIRAVQIGEGVGVGIDVSNWEALSEQPLLQFGAAVLDAAMIYGGYKGVESLNDDDDDKKDSNVNTTTIGVSGDNNTTTVVVGSGNTTTSNPNYDSNNDTATTTTKTTEY